MLKMLRATGDVDDAARAEQLTTELTAHWPRLQGLNSLERYCASDPCDPASARPDNITNTAQQYAATDVSKLRLGMSNTADDLFFFTAGTGLARFEPKVAINKQREFIANVIRRKGFPLRQALFQVHRDNALLTREDALRLVSPLVTGTSNENDDGLRENDRWIVSQYRQLLAFPHLTAKDQIEILLAQPPEDEILFRLIDVAKPLDKGTFESLLGKACRDNNECSQYRILAFGAFTETVISEGARLRLASLIRSESRRVRAETLHLVAKLGDDRLIHTVVKSGWDGAILDEDIPYEPWYGSMVILEAAARGAIPYDEALNRIAPQFYGWAAKKLIAGALRDVGRRMDVSIRKAAGLTIDYPAVDLELQVRSEDSTVPTLYYASERVCFR